MKKNIKYFPKNKRILITGSSGTIGTALFEQLLKSNYDVIGFDKRLNKWRPELNKLTIKGNLLNKKDIAKISKNIGLIIHLAANARVYDLVLEPNMALENAVSTFNILEFARSSGIKNVMFASSREVYGNKEKPVSAEKDANIELCESTYSASKLSGESFVRAYSKCYGIDFVIFRFSNVYGRYDESNRLAPLMIRKMQKNEPVVIYGKDKFLDFTYIDDCIGGIEKAIVSFDAVKNNVFNIASGRGENLAKIVQIIKEKLQSKSSVSIEESRIGEVVQYVADISFAKKSFGFNPEYNIEKGLELAINWYKQHGNHNQA